MAEEYEDEESTDGYIEIHENVNKQYHVFLDEPIVGASHYRQLKHLLNTATENDEVIFYINTEGGNVYAALGIIEAMNRSKAKIHSIIEGECMSAGTLIMLNSDKVTITDSAAIMCHSAHYSPPVSHVTNVKKNANSFHEIWRNIERKTYSGFLTDEELADISKGVEIWFSAEETKSRMKSLIEYRKMNKGIAEPLDSTTFILNE